jgi:hypothetical protein
MLTSKSRRQLLNVGAAFVLNAAPRLGLSQGKPAARRAGVANFVNGEVTIADSGGKRILTSGTVIKEGDTLDTVEASEAHVAMDDGGYLALRPSSWIQIETVKIAGSFDDYLSMRLFAGAMRSITGWVGKFDRSKYKISTPTATIGIRGTDHQVAIIAAGEERSGEIAGVHNWVKDGGTTLKSAGGEMDVSAGHAAWAGHNGQAPKAHEGIPVYLVRRSTRFEGRIENHAKRITEHIETRMHKRGMIKAGESLEDAQRRHQSMKSEVEPPKPEKATAQGHDKHKHPKEGKKKHQQVP